MLTGLIAYLSQVPLLAVLPSETLDQIAGKAEQRRYRRRQVIYFPDQASDFVYNLCSGRVKISRVSDQGREMTLALLEGVSLFGEAGLLLPEQAYEQSAETIEASVIVVIKGTALLEVLTQNPPAMLEVLRLVSERRTLAEAMIADLVFLDTTQRLAKLLLQRHEEHRYKTSYGAGQIKTKLTHQEMANIVGSTRETTTLVLNEFKHLGYIDVVNHLIIIRRHDGLEELLHSVP